MINTESQKSRKENQPKNNPKNKIDKLVAFFKSLKMKKPVCDAPDYSSWNQTEEEYQEEQAAWLAAVKAKNKLKQD